MCDCDKPKEPTLRQQLADDRSIYVQYMRDKKRNPIGCVVAVPTHREEGSVYSIGWSKFNVDKEPADKRFDKDLATFKAHRRAVDGNSLLSFPECMTEFIHHVLEKISGKYEPEIVIVK